VTLDRVAHLKNPKGDEMRKITLSLNVGNKLSLPTTFKTWMEVTEFFDRYGSGKELSGIIDGIRFEQGDAGKSIVAYKEDGSHLWLNFQPKELGEYKKITNLLRWESIGVYCGEKEWRFTWAANPSRKSIMLFSDYYKTTIEKYFSSEEIKDYQPIQGDVVFISKEGDWEQRNERMAVPSESYISTIFGETPKISIWERDGSDPELIFFKPYIHTREWLVDIPPNYSTKISTCPERAYPVATISHKEISRIISGCEFNEDSIRKTWEKYRKHIIKLNFDHLKNNSISTKEIEMICNWEKARTAQMEEYNRSNEKLQILLRNPVI
jgi:hypothetical protein